MTCLFRSCILGGCRSNHSTLCISQFHLHPPPPPTPSPGHLHFFLASDGKFSGVRILELQIPQGGDEKRGQMLYDKAQCASPSPAYLEILIVVERNEGKVKRAVKSRLWVCFRGFRLLICALAKRNYHLYKGYDNSMAILTLT